MVFLTAGSGRSVCWNARKGPLRWQELPNRGHNVQTMNSGKLLVVIGLTLAAVGALMWIGQGVKWLRLFRLPGDIVIERPGFSFYMPFLTMLLVSALFTAVLLIVRMLGR